MYYFALQLDALTHPFFDELRDASARLPNGRFLPPLFNFKPHGITYAETLTLHLSKYNFYTIKILFPIFRAEGCTN